MPPNNVLCTLCTAKMNSKRTRTVVLRRIIYQMLMSFSEGNGGGQSTPFAPRVSCATVERLGRSQSERSMTVLRLRRAWQRILPVFFSSVC